ncbi:phosphate starvation-inducible protein PhoH, predicted ATPase [Mycobacteroides abscessus subsp. massiliense]|uniref:hypothetical protein n=1 Tax=Mycobacteroides abscessus TaxID=36809 RepID=UPI0009A71BD0|nr:hypothetical protein [Mycobacteroides abscessus]SKT52550.1 phosphate starvation-inducible protein PhoH, predicted ATPase [Mycobacteroides abscessus subsp. massiliense]
MNAHAQPLDTATPTPDGFRRLDELAPGHNVFGSDGTPTAVLSINDIGVTSLVRIHFDDGAKADVATESLWHARDEATGMAGIYRTTDIVSNLQLPGGAPRWTIPTASAVEFPVAAGLPVDPLTFGSELRSGEATDAELLSRYLTADLSQRRETLAGVLGARTSIGASAPSMALAAAGSLIRSLGGLPTWVRHGVGYSLVPLWGQGDDLRREIVSAEPISNQPCRGITVAAADGLYLTGGDFVLTLGGVLAEQRDAA